jgi:hypothetical protein
VLDRLGVPITAPPACGHLSERVSARKQFLPPARPLSAGAWGLRGSVNSG